MSTRYFHTTMQRNKFHNRQKKSFRNIRCNIRVPNSVIRKITKAEEIKKRLQIKRKQVLIKKLIKEIKDEELSLNYSNEQYIPLPKVVKNKNKSKKNKQKTEKTIVKYINNKRKIDPETSMMMTLTFFSVIYYLVSKWVEL